MESGDGYASVMDHGLTYPSTDYLPKLTCSKFLVLGNPHMRRKKRPPKKEKLWPIPRRREGGGNADPRRSDVTAGQFMEQEGAKLGRNLLDLNGIYGAAFYRTLKLTQPRADIRGVDLRDRIHLPEVNPEQTYIDTFYRDRSRLLLSSLAKKSTRRISSSRLPASISSDRRHHSAMFSQVCQGPARHYCDVVGQRYCGVCLRSHRLDKLALTITQELQLQYRSNSRSPQKRPLPKISPRNETLANSENTSSYLR